MNKLNEIVPKRNKAIAQALMQKEMIESLEKIMRISAEETSLAARLAAIKQIAKNTLDRAKRKLS